MSSRIITWAHSHMPTREQLEANRFVRPFAHRVLRSELWRFTRRSVPRGVALGLLVGIVVPLGQFFLAALLSVSVRANVPVAVLATLVTNPFTTPFLWVAAYQVGQFILRSDGAATVAPLANAMQSSQFDRALQWLSGATLVTAVGLAIIAVVSAALGYLLSGLFWRLRIMRLRRARGRRLRNLHDV